MQKHEFETLAGRRVTDEQYDVIETVYMWHPSIQNTSGKEEVAELFKAFGMTIFHDLFPRAERLRILDTKFQETRQELEKLRLKIAAESCMDYGTALSEQQQT